MNTEWQCTDPDNEQYGRYISDRIYEFKEKNRGLIGYGNGEFIEIYINLNNYTLGEIEEVADTYYGSLDELKEQCGDSWEWILAECIFEQESGLY